MHFGESIFLFGIYPSNPLNTKDIKENQSFYPLKEKRNFRVLSHRRGIDGSLEFLFFIKDTDVNYIWDVPRFQIQLIEVAKYQLNKKLTCCSENICLKNINWKEIDNSSLVNSNIHLSKKQMKIIHELDSNHFKIIIDYWYDIIIFPKIIYTIYEKTNYQGIYLFIFEDDDIMDYFYENFHSLTNLSILVIKNCENVYLFDKIFRAFDENGIELNKFFSYSIVFTQKHCIEQNFDYFMSIDWWIIFNLSNKEIQMKNDKCLLLNCIETEKENKNVESFIKEKENNFMQKFGNFQTTIME